MTTTGQAVTATLRKYMTIGTRTRRYARGEDRNATMVDYLTYASTDPGYFAQATEDALSPARYAVSAYQKHVGGYRINPVTSARIRNMTPWQFSAFLGQMVDSGCTNNGEFESWFAAL